MDITLPDIERLALLTRLGRNTEEDKRYLSELGNVLKYVARLSNIDTQGVPETEPMFQGFIGRKDELIQQDPNIREQIIKNFPDSLAGALRVPAVFEKPKK